MLGVRVIHLEVTMVGDWKVGFCHLNMWWIANVGCAKFKGVIISSVIVPEVDDGNI
jgi:hypothetical protein